MTRNIYRLQNITHLRTWLQERAKVADKVMLNRHNIKTKRPTEKLDNKYFRPFVIKRKVGQRKLRVRYNHSQRNNHTKFFAKLFSHWLKTPFFRLHPLFYRERSKQPPFSCLPLAIKGRRKLPSTLRFLPLKESSPPHLPALSRPFLRLLSNHQAKQPPLYTTTPESWTPNSIGLNGYWKKERNPLSPANSPLLFSPPV